MWPSLVDAVVAMVADGNSVDDILYGPGTVGTMKKQLHSDRGCLLLVQPALVSSMTMTPQPVSAQGRSDP